jgi:ribosomal protein S13
MLSVLLLALAQQNFLNVKHIDQRRESRVSIALNAIVFVKSEEFGLMCRAIGMKPDRMRELSPMEAMKLLELITNEKESTNEFD